MAPPFSLTDCILSVIVQALRVITKRYVDVTSLHRVIVFVNGNWFQNGASLVLIMMFSRTSQLPR